MPDNDTRAEATELLARVEYARITGLDTSGKHKPWADLGENVRDAWRDSFTRHADVLVEAGWRPSMPGNDTRANAIARIARAFYEAEAADELASTGAKLPAWGRPETDAHRAIADARMAVNALGDMLATRGPTAAPVDPYAVVGDLLALVPTRITTAEELDALPEGAVIRSRYGTAAQKTEDAWEFPNEVGRSLSEIIDLPATVLWAPGKEATHA